MTRTNEKICKDWSCSVEWLKLAGVERLSSISPNLFIQGLSNIKFPSIKKFATTACEGDEFEYCDLQTKPFESTQQLLNGMQIINSNSNVLNSMNDLCLQATIDAQFEHTVAIQRDGYFEQICDILSQWIDNWNINVYLQFDIMNTSNMNTDFKYSHQFALCLCDKISNRFEPNNIYHHKINNSNSNDNSTDLGDEKEINEYLKLLKQKQFVSPYYGGNSKHFYNAVRINDRTLLRVHMKDKNTTSMSHWSPIVPRSKAEIELAIQLMSKHTRMSQTNITTCQCYSTKFIKRYNIF